MATATNQRRRRIRPRPPIVSVSTIGRDRHGEAGGRLVRVALTWGREGMGGLSL